MADKEEKPEEEKKKKDRKNVRYTKGKHAGTLGWSSGDAGGGFSGG